MKFAKTNADMQAQMHSHAAHFIEYKEMKILIKAIVECDKQGGCCGPARTSRRGSPLTQVSCKQEFMISLEQSQERVFQFMDVAVANLSARLMSTMQRIAASKGAAPRVIDGLATELSEVSRDASNLALFAYHNAEGFRKILKKYCKKVGDDIRNLCMHRIHEKEKNWDNAFYQIVVAVGDAHAATRQSQLAPEKDAAGDAWQPPACFERTTRKYLVQTKDIRKVELLIAEHLPVLVIGRKPISAGKVPEDFLCADKETWLSSIYLDDDAFTLYHGRVMREEGARLFRLRWYGDFHEPPDDSEVFVERKTHHESWVQERSVKERFAMRFGSVPLFLTGVRKHAAPKDSALAATSLADEIRGEIEDRALVAKVRTVYKRTAFQRTDSNAVRISIDTELSFVNEMGADEAGRWCRRVPAAGFRSEQVVTFPWAVLEVKLTEGQPEWIEQLLGSGLVHELHKFSKFAHGVACFNDESGRLRELPYWQARLKELEASNADLSTSLPAEVSIDVGIDDSPSKSVHQARPSMNLSCHKAHLGDQSTPSDAMDDASLFPDGKAGLCAAPVPPPGLRRRMQAKVVRVRAALPSRPRFLGGGKGQKAKAEKPGVPKRPAKIEPKTFFANERTFVQWISPVMALVAVALGLQGLGDFIANDIMAWTGASLNIMAMLWMLYALHIYLQRLRKIKRADPHGWDLCFGPIMLVIMLTFVCAVGSTMLLADHFNPKAMKQEKPVVLARAGCMISQRSDFPSLDVEPSGVVHHPGRGTLFVVSQNALYELPEAGGEPVAVYAAPGMDLEGVALDPAFPDRVVVAHEDPGATGSRLYAVDLNTSEVQRFIDFDSIKGLEHFKPEALSFCPPAVCGAGGTHFVMAGLGPKVHVVRVEPKDGNGDQSHKGRLVESFDTASVLCSLAGRCGTNKKVNITKLSGISVTDDAIHVINDDNTRELWTFRVNLTSGRRALSSVDIHLLPNVAGWEGISVRAGPNGTSNVVLASDDMGFVAEFNLTDQGLVSRCD
mmetsp:Transcript_7187/g.19311  ORF Transcript_7187/g.19311 Transcript_7187/m.19311 type:complete len:1011 (-) Transcript_7187:121-3153(-)